MSSRPSTPTPILPPMRTSRPAWAQTWATSAVVVDLPLVPVIATTFGRLWTGLAAMVRAKSSMSPSTSTPASFAIATVQCGAGWVSGTPGATTSALRSDQSARPRSSSAKPSPRAASRASALSSQTTTSAWPALRARAAARPERARPNTATFLPSKPRTGIMAPLQALLSQLQGGEAQEGQHDGDDPEPDHDGGFGPAQTLKMVVDRRHAENALAGQPEGGDLHHHRYGLEHEEAAHNRKHDLVLRGHGDGA